MEWDVAIICPGMLKGGEPDKVTKLKTYLENQKESGLKVYSPSTIDAGGSLLESPADAIPNSRYVSEWVDG